MPPQSANAVTISTDHLTLGDLGQHVLASVRYHVGNAVKFFCAGQVIEVQSACISPIPTISAPYLHLHSLKLFKHLLRKRSARVGPFTSAGRPNPVTVGAHHLTFGDLCQNYFLTTGVHLRNISHLVRPGDVVEIEGDRVKSISTVKATAGQLQLVQPKLSRSHLFPALIPRCRIGGARLRSPLLGVAQAIPFGCC